MLNNALRCLKNVTFDETSLYVKALMAYVFTLTKDVEMRQELLDKLEKETGKLLPFKDLDFFSLNSQNCRSWKGPLEVISSNPPAKAGFL